MIRVRYVAPYVGAWIETHRLTGIYNHQYVAPYVGAWIETIYKDGATLCAVASHPTWVRGLKPRCKGVDCYEFASHPTWVRGLKQQIHHVLPTINVAPYVGAWIETCMKDDGIT